MATPDILLSVIVVSPTLILFGLPLGASPLYHEKLDHVVSVYQERLAPIGVRMVVLPFSLEIVLNLNDNEVLKKYIEGVVKGMLDE